MEKKKIIIIGSGIAGLSAGCYLQMNGYDTEIFELHNTACIPKFCSFVAKLLLIAYVIGNCEPAQKELNLKMQFTYNEKGGN